MSKFAVIFPAQFKNDQIDQAEALGLKNVGGVFVVLISGLGVAFIIAVVEYYFERYRRNKRLRYSIVSNTVNIFPRLLSTGFCDSLIAGKDGFKY